MSRVTRTSSHTKRQRGGETSLPAGARVDQPHQIQHPPAESASDLEPAAVTENRGETAATTAFPGDDEDRAARMERHAQRLSEALSARQAELDRREAQLHAQSAEFDNQQRAARLWLQERLAELEQSQQDLTRREDAVQQRLADLSAAEHYYEASQRDQRRRQCQHEEDLLEREATLEQRRVQLAQAEAALKTATASLAAERRTAYEERLRETQRIETRREASLQLVRLLMAGIERRREELQEWEAAENRRRERAQSQAKATSSAAPSAELTAQLARLAEAEQLLITQREEVEHFAAKLEQERETWIRQQRSQQRRQELETRKNQEELQRREQLLHQREQELDQREGVVEGTREQISRLHQECLELRLATEELWAQLQHQLPGPRLTTELGQVRQRLAEHYRLAQEELADRQHALAMLRDELAGQCALMNEQRHEMQRWFTDRQSELTAAQNKVAARQLELDDREADWRQMQDRWLRERLDLQDRLRELLQEQARGQST